MTEEEWLVCEEPTPMIESLPCAATERKLRLFACACCHRVREWFEGSGSFWELVEICERYADEQAHRDEVARAAHDIAIAGFHNFRGFNASLYTAGASYYQFAPGELDYDEAYDAYEATRVAYECARFTVGDKYWALTGDETEPELVAESVAQSGLLRDIFGNPFRPVPFSPSWRSDTTMSLARQMYDSRDFGAMPILADALQDAGCEDEQILHHCRDANQPHVRGCWVVDLVLEKS